MGTRQLLKICVAYFDDSRVLGWLTGDAGCKEDFWKFRQCTGEVAVSFLATVGRSSGEKYASAAAVQTFIRVSIC